MATFNVGQKVVCIDDRFKNVSIDQGIRKGQIYTVRWVGHYRHYVDGDFYGIKLMELYRGNDDGPEGYGAVDMPFRATRFRPLVSDRIKSMLGIKAPAPICPDPDTPPAGQDPASCQIVEAPPGDGQRLVRESAEPPVSRATDDEDGEIRLTYRQLSALIEDAVRSLK